ncbi:S1/P1 nuclease [Undibacterium fentianense]|uniref:S1/P1 nuclease n=1 Tax=Undibacterium fentianense TaxID=2828728 RepID=A0A941IC49_9BURK|nr:S1/P1 nuclease [Undibacterium fentianense]MBR7799819.1 S1/P1 nuclease [Undibacterium fentianense]
MNKIKSFVLLCGAALSLSVVSLHAVASGDEGHKTVGAIADRLLKGTNAGAKVQALLQSGESLQSLSIWADCAKGTFCGPQTSEMVAFTIQNPAHAAYHYTNTPVQNTAYIAGGVGTTDHDIVQTLKQAIAVLQGKDTESSNPHRFTPRQALLMIAHLVGDIHQPLHVGAAYINSENQFVTPTSKQQVDGVTIFDLQGGNNLLIEDKATWTARDVELFKRDEAAAKAAGSVTETDKPKRIGKPLHLYWDVTVVENVMRKLGVRTVADLTDKMLAAPVPNSQNSGDPITWPEQWANEGLVSAKVAYSNIVATERIKVTSRRGIEFSSWYTTLPSNYIETSTEITQKQLQLAGYRLAALLQKIWP